MDVNVKNLYVQEHFVPRLKGGVFILNDFEAVALFKNFELKECRIYDEEGNCMNGKYQTLSFPWLENVLTYKFSVSNQ